MGATHVHMHCWCKARHGALRSGTDRRDRAAEAGRNSRRYHGPPQAERSCDHQGRSAQPRKPGTAAGGVTQTKQPPGKPGRFTPWSAS